MTGVLLTTIAILLMLCATLTVLLIGRDRAATKRENMLTALADELAKKLAAETTKARHLQERNAELRDELDALTAAKPSMTAQMLADLAALPTTHEREYPR